MIKKIAVLFLMLFACALAYEDVPLLIDTSVINVEVDNNDENIIKVDNMKKAQNLKDAQNKAKTKEKPVLNIDTRQIHQQRTLQYMDNRGGSSMLPIF